MNTVLRGGLVSAALAGLLAASGSAFAEEMKFSAELKGSEEVPAVETSATGTTTATYDPATKKFSWTLEYGGLSGDATAAHFHLAAPGEDARSGKDPRNSLEWEQPIVPIPELASGSEGSVDLTDEQAADLLAGKWYVNVHSAKHPDGEIRGHLARAE